VSNESLTIYTAHPSGGCVDVGEIKLNGFSIVADADLNKLNLDKVKLLAAQYLESLDDEDRIETYGSCRAHASGEISDFIDFIEAQI